MKNIILIISLLLISTLLFSCAQQIDIESSQISSAAFESTISEGSDESEPIPSSFLLSVVEIETPFGKTKSKYTYNEKGRIIKIVSLNNDIEYRREETIYDNKGFIIEKKVTILDNSGNVKSTDVESYINSEEGLPISGTVTTTSGGSEMIVSVLYEYDDYNRLLLQTDKDSNAE
jgi:hypothetical protein